ncbi:MAG: hypothetical protein R2789_12430 [Microthrixaceae bacterium]
MELDVDLEVATGSSAADHVQALDGALEFRHPAPRFDPERGPDPQCRSAEGFGCVEHPRQFLGHGPISEQVRPVEATHIPASRVS